jgi:hypothetical protein
MGRALGLGALTLGPGLVIFVLSYLNPMPPRLAEYVLLLTGPVTLFAAAGWRLLAAGTGMTYCPCHQ